MRFNFDSYIAERTQNYSPRPWLFARIGEWTAKPGRSRYFLITAEPGGGKTGVAGQVCNLSRGLASDHGSIPRGAIAAHHFCFSKYKDWLDPSEFSESIGGQLAISLPGFEAEQLRSQPELRPVEARGEVKAESISGTAVGLALHVGAETARTKLTREVLRPLRGLYRNGFDRDVVILVDALDEARLFTGSETILDLITGLGDDLPRVRFLLTSRPEDDIVRTMREHDAHLVHVSLSGGTERRESRNDIQVYVAQAVGRAPEITGKLAPELTPAALGEMLSQRADGNFLWTHYVLETLRAPEVVIITPATVNALPSDLREFYLDFLRRLAKANAARWLDEHAKVLGMLVVAMEELTRDELRQYCGLDRPVVTRVLRDIRQLLDVTEDEAEPRYSLYHRSFADFVLSEAAEEQQCEEPKLHLAIVRRWLESIGSDDGRDVGRSDRYAQRNIAAHLFALRNDPGMRRELFGLASKPWMDLKRRVFGHDASFANDVSLVAEAAAESRDSMVEIRATAILVAVRSCTAAIPSAALVLLARLGKLDRVRSYLALPYSPEARLRAVSEIARAIMDDQPAEAEALLTEALLLGPAESAASGARTLRASALARLGRFDEVLSLLGVIGPEAKNELEQIAILAAAGGRNDVAERVLTIADQSSLVERLIAATLERGDAAAALQWAQRLPEWPRDEALSGVALWLRSRDLASAVFTSSTIATRWKRTASYAELLADAARESAEAEAALASLLPAKELPRLVQDAIDKLLTTRDVDIAARLAARGDADALAAVDGARIAELVAAGDRETARALAGGDSSRTRAYVHAVARHAGGKAFVAAIHAARSEFDVEEAVAEMARHREPKIVQQVLDDLGALATESILARAARELVGRSESAAAITIAKNAAQRLRGDVIREISAAAAARGDADTAWEAYELDRDALSWKKARVVSDLIEHGATDRARAILDGDRQYVGSKVREPLIDVLVRRNRIEEAVDVASKALSHEQEALYLRVLVAAKPQQMERVVPAIAPKCRDFEELFADATRKIVLRGDVEAIDRLATATNHPLGQRFLVAAAIEAFERDMVSIAITLLSRVSELGSEQIPEDDAIKVTELLGRATAIDAAERWIAHDGFAGYRGVLLATLAEALARKWHHARAEELLERARRWTTNPPSPRLRARLSMASQALGKGTADTQALAASHTADVTSSEALDVATALARAGATATAFSVAERAGPVVLAALAPEFARLGQAADAHEASRRAVEVIRHVDRNTALPIVRHLVRAGATDELLPLLDTVGASFLIEICARGRRLKIVRDILGVGADDALDHLASDERWDAAIALYAAAPSPERLRHLFGRAARARRLAPLARAARDAGVQGVDELLRSFAEFRSDLVLRIESVPLLGEDFNHDRQRLAETLVKAGDLDTAFELASGITMDWMRQRAMGAVMAAAIMQDVPIPGPLKNTDREGITEAVAEALIEHRRFDDAAQWARLLRRSGKERIVGKLVAAGEIDKGIRVAQMETGWDRDVLLKQAAVSIAQTDREKAQTIARQIEDAAVRLDALTGIIEAIIRGGDAKGALQIIATAPDIESSIESLTGIATALFDAGHATRADKVIESALHLINALEDDVTRNNALAELSAALCSRHLFDEAERVALLLEGHDDAQADALLVIARHRSNAGQIAAARDLAKRGLAAARRATGTFAAETEAELMATIGALSSRREFRERCVIAAVMSRKHDRPGSMFVHLTEARAVRPWYLPPARFRGIRGWWWRQRSPLEARRLLRAALLCAEDERSYALRAELMASVAARLAQLGRKRKARALIRALDQRPMEWRLPEAMLAQASLARAHYLVEQREAAFSVAGNALSAFVDMKDLDYRFAHVIGRMLATLEAPQPMIDRLINAAMRHDDPYKPADILRVVTAAIEGIEHRARRIGDALARASMEAPDHVAAPLCTALVTCSEVVTPRGGFLSEAETLARRLSRRDAAGVLPDLAVTVARIDPSTTAWIEMALDAIAAERNQETQTAARATVALALLGAKRTDEAKREMSKAIAASRQTNRRVFFDVLRNYIRGASDESLPKLAAALVETERWWEHR